VFGDTEHALTQAPTQHLFNPKFSLLEAIALARDMMLTPDEYMALMRLITSERESEGASLADRDMDASTSKPVKRRSRSARAADKKLSKAFAQANSRYRKKDGSLRTGRTQSDIAKLAQKLRKKM